MNTYLLYFMPVKKNVLDKKNRRIIKELFRNARQSYSYIAKQVGLSKEVVAYRIKGMLDQKILLRFNTVIDVNKLGFETYLVYVRLRNIDVAKEEEILSSFAKNPNTAWVVKCLGRYDCILKVFVQKYSDIAYLMDAWKATYIKYIDTYTIDILVFDDPIPLSFLYEKKRKEVYTLAHSDSIPVNLHKLDYKILSTLAQNARMPIADIGRRNCLSRDQVVYHLRLLEKKKIIKLYRPSTRVGMKKLGYMWFFVRLDLSVLSSSVEKQLESFLANTLYVTYLYRTIGSSSINIELRVQNMEQLQALLMDLRSLLRSELKRLDFLLIFKEYKYTYWPECMEGVCA
jgi:DNA-binding Lrp family transcriptional regulator